MENLLEVVQFQIAGGPVAVEGDLLGPGLGHGEGLRVEPQRVLVLSFPIHLMRPLDLVQSPRHLNCPRTPRAESIQNPRKSSQKLEIFEEKTKAKIPISLERDWND